MSISPYRIVLSGGFGSVTIASDRQAAEASSGLRVDWDSGGVAGWDSAPDAKVSSTERQAGDGAHDVSESDIEYESRVVTVNIAAFGETRDEVLAAMRRLQAAHKQLVTMRVVDASSDTYCERGYVVVKWDEEWHEQTATGTLTAVFVRPHRLSTLPSEGVMVPATGGGGGLVFDDTSNLTPFFSHSLTDTSYWALIDTEHVTQLTDGWAHFEIPAKSPDAVWSFYEIKPIDGLVAGATYTVLAEIRNSSNLTQQSFHGGGAAQVERAAPSFGGGDGRTYISVTMSDDVTGKGKFSDSYIVGSTTLDMSFDMRLSLYEGTYTGAYKPYALPCAPTVYYKLATPTTVQLTPHLPVVRTGIKTLSVGADVVPTLSATVKSMD